MMIYINTFDKLNLDSVFFGKTKNWLLVISNQKSIIHIFTNTDERVLKSMMLDFMAKDKGQ